MNFPFMVNCKRDEVRGPEKGAPILIVAMREYVEILFRPNFMRIVPENVKHISKRRLTNEVDRTE